MENDDGWSATDRGRRNAMHTLSGWCHGRRILGRGWGLGRSVTASRAHHGQEDDGDELPENRYL
jgi:hypothetical protein